MTKSGKPMIDEALARRISDALSSDEGLAADAALMEQLAAEPAAGRYARDIGRLDKWLASWPAATPSDSEFEAMAQRIEQGLKQLPTGLMQPFLAPPAFDDEDARRDAQGQLPAKPGPYKAAFPKPGAMGTAAKPSIAALKATASGAPPSLVVPAPSASAAGAGAAAAGAAAAGAANAPEAALAAPPEPASVPAAALGAPEIAASEAAASSEAAEALAVAAQGPAAPTSTAQARDPAASAEVEPAAVTAPEAAPAREDLPAAVQPAAAAALDSVPAPLGASAGGATGEEVEIPVDADEPPPVLDPGRSTISLIPEAISLVPEPPAVVSRPAPPKEAAKPSATKSTSGVPAASRWAAAKAPVDDRFSIPVPAPRAPVFSLDPIQNVPPPEPERRTRAAWPMWAAAAAVGLAVAAGGTLLLQGRSDSAAPLLGAAEAGAPAASATATVASASPPAPEREAAEVAAPASPVMAAPAMAAPAEPAPTEGTPLASGEVVAAPRAAMGGAGGAGLGGAPVGAALADASDPTGEARAAGRVPASPLPRRRAPAPASGGGLAAREESALAPATAGPTRGASGGAAGSTAPAAAPATAAASRSAESDAELPETPDRSSVRDALEGVAPQVQACFGEEHGVVDVVVMVASSGRVTTCTVSGRFAGTPVGSCIARAVRAARFPPFTQARFEVHYQYRN